MDELKNKVNTIIPIVENVKLYFTEISELIHDKSKISSLMSGIEQLDHLRDKLLDRLTVKFDSGLAYDKLATLIFQTFEIIKRYELIIRQIQDFLNNTSFTLELFASNMTRTRGNEIIKNGMSLLTMLLKHNKEFTLDKIIAYFITQLSNPKLADLEKLSELFEKYPLTIELYGQLVQTLINKNKEFLYPLLDQIEYHKSRVLFKPSDQPKLIAGQHSFKCFNLVPNAIPSKVSIPTLEKKHNVIILNKFTRSTVVIDGWKDWKTIAPFVSMDLIEAGKTLSITTNKVKTAKFTFTISEHKSSDTWVVLDTFDGENYRFLKPWTNDATVLHENHIRGLLTYLGFTKPIDHHYITRATNINQIQQERIIKESKIVVIDPEVIIDKVESEVDAPKLKQMLNIKMLKIPHKSTIDLLNNPKLVKVLMESVRPPNRDKLNPETHMTYIIELGLLKQRFIKSVFSKFAILNDITCIRAALDDVITNSANIHRAILYKHELLSAIRT